MPQLILPYVREVMSKQSELEREEHVCSSMEVYVKALAAIEARKLQDVRKVI